jgi:pilus assembly protein CpaF
LVVQLDMRTTTINGTSQRRRRVAEIIAITPGERETGYATTHVFTPDPEATAVPAVLPEEYRALASYGFDLAAYLMQQQVRS